MCFYDGCGHGDGPGSFGPRSRNEPGCASSLLMWAVFLAIMIPAVLFLGPVLSVAGGILVFPVLIGALIISYKASTKADTVIKDIKNPPSQRELDERRQLALKEADLKEKTKAAKAWSRKLKEVEWGRQMCKYEFWYGMTSDFQKALLKKPLANAESDFIRHGREFAEKKWLNYPTEMAEKVASLHEKQRQDKGRY